MKVLVAGTFCSGKTTLASDVHSSLGQAVLVSDICREVLNEFGAVDWRTPELRDYLIIRQLLVEKQFCASDKINIVDGGVIGNIAHDRVLLEEPSSRCKLIETLGHEQYGLVLLCDYEEISIVDDGQRFIDATLRSRVHEQVLNALEELGYREYFVLQGTRDTRVSEAVKLISAIT